MELTLIYMLGLTLITLARPMVGLFFVIVLPQPGITGVLQDTIGLKQWAGQPACVMLGCLAVIRVLQDRKSDRFWSVVALACSGLYIIAASLLKGDVVQLFFSAVFHGGLLAAFFVYNWENERLWTVVLAGMLTLLILSAATYWLTGMFPFLSRLEGMSYIDQAEVMRSAENVDDVVGRLARGGGVFHNQNCWAQMAALGVVIGLAMAILTKSLSRFCGLLLFVVSVLGILGSIGRSATFAAFAGAVCLLGGRYLTRSAALRLSTLVSLAVIGWGVISWAEERSMRDDAFQLGTPEGAEWRADQVRGVIKRFDKYWIMGGMDPDPDKVQDHPHDIVFAYIFYFGMFPAMMAVLGMLGGLLATVRWIAVGGEKLGREMELPANLSWAGHAVVPVFIVVMLNGLGNGIAAGTPYREIFLAYLYVGVRIRRSIAPRRMHAVTAKAQGRSAA